MVYLKVSLSADTIKSSLDFFASYLFTAAISFLILIDRRIFSSPVSINSLLSFSDSGNGPSVRSGSIYQVTNFYMIKLSFLKCFLTNRQHIFIDRIQRDKLYGISNKFYQLTNMMSNFQMVEAQEPAQSRSRYNPNPNNNRLKLAQEYPTTDTSMEETYFRVFAARNKARHGSNIRYNSNSSNNNKYECSQEHHYFGDIGNHRIEEVQYQDESSQNYGNSIMLNKESLLGVRNSNIYNNHQHNDDYRSKSNNSKIQKNQSHYNSHNPSSLLKDPFEEDHDVLELLGKAYREIKERDQAITSRDHTIRIQQQQLHQNSIRMRELEEGEKSGLWGAGLHNNNSNMDLLGQIQILKRKLEESDSEALLLNTKIIFLQSQLKQVKEMLRGMQQQYALMQTKTSNITHILAETTSSNGSRRAVGKGHRTQKDKDAECGKNNDNNNIRLPLHIESVPKATVRKDRQEDYQKQQQQYSSCGIENSLKFSSSWGNLADSWNRSNAGNRLSVGKSYNREETLSRNKEEYYYPSPNRDRAQQYTFRVNPNRIINAKTGKNNDR